MLGTSGIYADNTEPKGCLFQTYELQPHDMAVLRKNMAQRIFSKIIVPFHSISFLFLGIMMSLTKHRILLFTENERLHHTRQFPCMFIEAWTW